MEGFEDPFNRKCYPWGGEDGDLIAYYERLGRIRADKTCVLASGDYRATRAENGVFEFEREQDGKVLTVLINASEREIEVGGVKTDIISGKNYDKLPPFTPAVFYREI